MISARNAEAGMRIRVAGVTQAVRSATTARVVTRIGGDRQMRLLELADGTRYDVPVGGLVELAGRTRS